MSKTQDDAEVLTEAFRNMTVNLQPIENSTNVHNASSNEENYFCDLPSRNPFLINMIIKHLFGFLPLEDIKRSRLVCQEWNSAAEICLRKRSRINFRHDVLLPQTFMEFSKYSHPDLPFSSFAFSNDNQESSWDVADIQNFLEKWGKNIREVRFNQIKLTSNCYYCMYTSVSMSDYDVTPLFINPANITNLTICSYTSNNPETTLEISLENFVSLKTVYLHGCTIIVSTEDQITRIVPHTITIQSVSFLINEELYLNHFCLNDIFDFSKAVNIHLQHDRSGDVILDMGKNVFNVNKLILSNTRFENWALAKGDVQFLRLDESCFVEQNQLKIKQLSIAFSNIDLTALPQSLEYLGCKNCEISCSEPFSLPNLKIVSMYLEDSQSLIYFSKCTNLVELILSQCGCGQLSLDCVPKSVRTIKMEFGDIEFADECIFEVDTLILNGRCSDDCLKVTTLRKITEQIKAKVLIVKCGSRMCIDTSDIIKLVLAYKPVQKILIGSNYDLHKNTPFKESLLSKYVDKKSNHYQFENRVGKAITKEEFEIYAHGDFYYFPSGLSALQL